ncbi:MAG TPA: hypothetical protein ENJ28_02575 [Gammaproteobacteria bacterium]|nr:hypothetical protein [Gammaproteobacteria bacterium]
MAINQKKKQKMLAKKKKKRSLRKKIANISKNTRNPISLYAKYPIHECLIPDDLFSMGLGTVVVARRGMDDSIAVSAFVVDVYCLGVKDALFHLMSLNDYENDFKARIIASHEGDFESIHPTCVKKIITGSVQYAKNLGFSPHSDYRKYKGILATIDSNACPEKYNFGKDGKPFYIRGPNESITKANKIIKTLEKKCGSGNYDHLIML